MLHIDKQNIIVELQKRCWDKGINLHHHYKVDDCLEEQDRKWGALRDRGRDYCLLTKVEVEGIVAPYLYKADLLECADRFGWEVRYLGH